MAPTEFYETRRFGVGDRVRLTLQDDRRPTQIRRGHEWTRGDRILDGTLDALEQDPEIGWLATMRVGVAQTAEISLDEIRKIEVAE